MFDTKSRNNKNIKRLLKQINKSDFEYREYGAPKIRPKSIYNQTRDIIWYDLPKRSYFNNKNWKHYRKKQYK